MGQGDGIVGKVLTDRSLSAVLYLLLPDLVRARLLWVQRADEVAPMRWVMQEFVPTARGSVQLTADVSEERPPSVGHRIVRLHAFLPPRHPVGGASSPR